MGFSLERAVSKPQTRCRICGSHRLVRYLDIGVTPLANSYRTAAEVKDQEVTVELALQVCEDCGLSQLTQVVDPDLMFRDYLYVSSTTETFRLHCRELARTATGAAGCAPGDWILDIASNDGYLLSEFNSLGMRVYGVDPARNLAREATARGIPTIADYWSREIAREGASKFGRPKVITATNVVAHVDDLHEFVDAIASSLADRGIFVAEIPYLIDFIERNEFDTAYHEHLSYVAIHPLQRLMGSHGMEIFDAEHFPEIHGGTIRIYAARAGERLPSARLNDFLERERGFGITDVRRYLEFGARVERNMASLAAVLVDLSGAGKRIWAYGASAKGNTLMSYLGLTSEVIPIVVDDNPKKWDLYTPGSHMRIVSADRLSTAAVDYLLLLAWNFEDEIVRRSRALGYSGRYIRPVPAVAIID